VTRSARRDLICILAQLLAIIGGHCNRTHCSLDNIAASPPA
jgi:hypothetical protein